MRVLLVILMTSCLFVQQMGYVFNAWKEQGLEQYKGLWYLCNGTTHFLLWITILVGLFTKINSFIRWYWVACMALPINQLLDEKLLDPSKFQWNEYLAYVWFFGVMFIYTINVCLNELNKQP